jgi:hypothetical protein
VLAVLAAVLAAAPSPALACSSCSYGTSNSLMIYLGTAAFMGLLPLVMVGAFALWLRRRLRSRATVDASPDIISAEPLRSASPSPRS